MNQTDLDTPRKVPDRPRLRLGKVELLPAMDEAGKVIPATWLLPAFLPPADGRALRERRATETITTAEAMQRARANRICCELILV